MNEDTKKKEIQRIKNELLDINFCVSCIEINGVKYFTVITNETDLVKNIPEIFQNIKLITSSSFLSLLDAFFPTLKSPLMKIKIYFLKILTSL